MQLKPQLCPGFNFELPPLQLSLGSHLKVASVITEIATVIAFACRTPATAHFHTLFLRSTYATLSQHSGHYVCALATPNRQTPAPFQLPHVHITNNMDIQRRSFCYHATLPPPPWQLLTQTRYQFWRASAMSQCPAAATCVP